MQSAVRLLETLLVDALHQLRIPIPTQLHFEHPANSAFGDYSSNAAMVILGKKRLEESTSSCDVMSTYKSPRELAEAIVRQLNEKVIQQKIPDIKSIVVAGPGFINFTFSNSFLVRQLQVSLGIHFSADLKDKKIIVEFTDPNPFKEFHIGHLYSNTVGESISRLLLFSGAEVKRVCYQGDVGMHVAKSIWGLKEKLIDDSLTLANVQSWELNKRVQLLGQAYALGATQFTENEQAKQEMQNINYMCFLSAQEYLQKSVEWQPQIDYKQFIISSDLNYEEIKDLYQTGREWSLTYFNQIYKRLGMQFDDFYFESVVGEYGLKIVREFLEKGVFEKSQGAVIFPGSKYGLHDRVFINSLGLPTYECKELGLAPEKYKHFQYDESIIITGNEIDEYFKVLLTALKQVRPDLAVKTRHFSHGMVRLPDGKMSSRTGKVLTGEWLIDEAQKRVETIFNERDSSLVNQEREVAIEKIALGAIKYALLNHSLGSDITFSFDESLSFQGNSGPYLQYTFARCQSVRAKALQGQQKPKNGDVHDLSSYSLNDEERAVLRLLYRFNEAVQVATDELAPHHLCTYLFELAQVFNAFYNKHSILGKEAEDSEKVDPTTIQLRLLITQATAELIQQGLGLLGIQTVEKM